MKLDLLLHQANLSFPPSQVGCEVYEVTYSSIASSSMAFIPIYIAFSCLYLDIFSAI